MIFLFHHFLFNFICGFFFHLWVFLWIKEFCFLHTTAAAAAKLLQSCLTLFDPIDSSPPGSPVPSILQGRTLEWVAISFSNAWKWKVKVKSLSRVRLLVTPWTAAYQAPPSMGFSRQENWSGAPLPSPLLSYSYIHICNTYICVYIHTFCSILCLCFFNILCFALMFKKISYCQDNIKFDIYY